MSDLYPLGRAKVLQNFSLVVEKLETLANERSRWSFISTAVFIYSENSQLRWMTAEIEVHTAFYSLVEPFS